MFPYQFWATLNPIKGKAYAQPNRNSPPLQVIHCSRSSDHLILPAPLVMETPGPEPKAATTVEVSDEEEVKAIAADAGSVTGEGKRPDMAAAAAATASAADGDDGEEEEEEKPPVMVPMPLNTIAAILSLKREPRPTPEDLARLSPEERDERLAFFDSLEEVNDEFEEFQKEILREVKETGRYMVHESYFTEQAEMQARMEKEWAKIDWTGVKFGDWDYDDPTCCQPL